MAAIAAAQHGLITIAQLRDLGATRKMIRIRLRRGSLHEVYPSVYAVGHRPITQDARWLGAVLACGEGALLSHRSAAALWRIRNTAAPRIDVTAPTRRGYTRRAISLHRATTLQLEDRDEIRAIPVTSLPRTIVDLPTCISRSAVEYAIHNAERQRKLKPADLHEILERLSGVNGTAVVRRIVGRPGHDLDAQTRSRWELRFLEICRATDIPMPRVNEWIPLDVPAGGLEVDFSWPDLRLVVEVDEEAGHTTIRARKNDPRRDAALRAGGWRVLRVAESDFGDVRAIAARVRSSILARRRWQRRS
jgi:predicted transcriptional regulator of viral defense system